MENNRDEIVDMNVDQNIRLVTVDQLLGKFQSKSALYTMLTTHCKYIDVNNHTLVQYYLPSRRGTSLKFMRALLKGDKWVSISFFNKYKMLKVEQLKKLKVPNYPEISVKGLWDKFKEDDDVKKYFPDFKPNQLPERRFLLDILSTVKRDYMKKVIMSSSQTRNRDENIQNNEVIEIKQDLLSEIMKTSYNSSNINKSYHV